MTCDSVHQEIAVALLTRTPVTPEVAEHLATCRECTDLLVELSGVPPLLALAPAPEAELDDSLLARVLDSVVAERRRRRWRVALVSVAAAAVLVLVGSLVVWKQAQPRSSTTTVVASAVVRPLSKTWSHVDVAVTGLPSGTRCTVSAVLWGTTHHEVTTWTAGNYGIGRVGGDVPAEASGVTSVQLIDASTGAVITTVTPTVSSS